MSWRPFELLSHQVQPETPTMNILILDTDPLLAASYHCDRDVARHLLDAVSALFSAHYFIDGSQTASYRIRWSPTRIDITHPCCRWVQECDGNYDWTLTYLRGLLDEYRHRRFMAHSFEELYKSFAQRPVGIRCGECTPFHIGVPHKYRSSNPVLAYRQFYYYEKRLTAVWSYPASAPLWWLELEQEMTQ